MFWLRWNKLPGLYFRFDLDESLVVAAVVAVDPVLIVTGHEVDVAAYRLTIEDSPYWSQTWRGVQQDVFTRGHLATKRS